MPEPSDPPGDLPDGTEKIIRTPAAPPKPPERDPAWVPWALLLVALAGFMLFVFLAYLPLGEELDALTEQHQQALETVDRLTEQVGQLKQARAELESSKAELESSKAELEKVRADLASELGQQRKELEQFKQAQQELSHRLEAEMKKGQVLIRQANGQLVVDLVDKLMFDSAAVELNESGKDVLRRVAETLRSMPDKLIMVAGHTDNVPISDKLVDTYPTNWELSTARATGVVRFLQDECKIPGERLAAVGYSQYRPVGTNRNHRGRRRNRRIEVILMPRPRK